MGSQVDSYSMLICSKYIGSISDMINITLVNSKFKDTIDKFHFNPFKIDEKSRKYFNNLQTQWLFDERDVIFSDCDISGYYVSYQINYQKYLEMKDKYQNIKFRRIVYTMDDKEICGDKIPNVVNKLDKFLFSYSNTKEINIPHSIVEIGNKCFDCCQLLTSITMSSRLTKVGEDAFYCCNQLTSITLPSVLTSLNKYVFSGCNELTRIEYSPFVVNLDDCLFYENGFSTITIPTSITRIGDNCLKKCKFTSITIPSNVIEFGKYVFSYNSELEEVELPNNMIQLPDGMFSYCSKLTKINIPSLISKIGDYCFEYCIKLKEIKIPMSVVEIGKDAFKECSQLQSIIGNYKVCIKFKKSFENTPFLNQLNKKNKL